MAFSAFLDTCVLVPSRLRDVLLEIAIQGAYRPVWSDEVQRELTEVIQRLHRKRGYDEAMTSRYTRRLLEQMDEAFPDALVHVADRSAISDGTALPDPNDEHVVQAAVIGRADLIVTNNLRDFPKDPLPGDLFPQDADNFLLDLLDLHPELVVKAITAVSHRTGRKGRPLSPHDVAASLEKSAPQFAAKCHKALLNETTVSVKPEG